MAAETDHRLPRNVTPDRYRLTFDVDLDAARFRGTAEIDVTVHTPVSEVVVNARDLEIFSVRLRAGDRAVDATVRLEPETERAVFGLPAEIEPGPWVLEATFAGTLNDKLTGFYRSTFTDADGVTRTIATTQFESTHARAAFPCWDEPDLKAVFEVTLVVPAGMLAISATRPVADEPTGDGRRRVRFAPTIPLSTYLLAFVVGPLEATDPVEVDGVPVRVVHPPGKGHLARYPLEVGVFALGWLARWFGIPYPGDKLDLVALPDFAFGAMENLGAVTFREALLLVDPDTVTQGELQNVVDVIAHELAHMWFGDLVTMTWWEGVWLKEAFATFMEMKVTDAWRPDWCRWVAFGAERAAALETDALASTRPVEYEVRSPADAEGMYDVLTYQKGSALVRMLEQYLGEDRFSAAMTHYLSKHAYGNTRTGDLWDAIEEATGEPVRRTMDSWIYQGGYPLVTVDTDGRRLELTQSVFRLADPRADGPPPPLRWSVPVLVRIDTTDGASRMHRVLLEGETASVELPGEPERVVVNAGGHGFYRVAYPTGLLDALCTDPVGHLEPLERYMVVDDAWARVLAASSTAAAWITLARRFRDDPDLEVWERICGSLGQLVRVLDTWAPEPSPPAVARFGRLVAEVLAPPADRLGWEPAAGEDERTRSLRGLIWSTMVTLAGDPGVRERAVAVHERHLAEPGSVDVALVAPLVPAIAAGGDAALWDRYLERYESAPNPQEALRYLYALAAFDDPELFGRTLELALSDRVRTQNAPFLLRGALNHRRNGPAAWRFVTDHWERIWDRFPSMMIVRMVEGVVNLSTAELCEQTHAFFADHPIPQGARTLDQILERQRVRTGLREREAERLARFVS